MQLEDIDFLIIGAAKSGTTWLQRMLQLNPHVFMPDPELHYFSRVFDRPIPWYLDRFRARGTQRLVGEKSNSYLNHPEAARRIATFLPHAKLIVQLRNPVDRAYSHYCMLYRRGEVSSDIASHLSFRDPMENRCVRGGLYHHHLVEYLKYFRRDQILVLIYEDTMSAPFGGLRQVGKFLGVELHAAPEMLASKVKDRAEPILPQKLRRLMRPLKPAVRPLRNKALFQAAHGLLSHQVRYPSLPDHLRRDLTEFYAPEVRHLGELLERDLTDWPLPAQDRNRMVKAPASDRAVLTELL